VELLLPEVGAVLEVFIHVSFKKLVKYFLPGVTVRVLLAYAPPPTTPGPISSTVIVPVQSIGAYHVPVLPAAAVKAITTVVIIRA
jgi:hypothetical protein